MSAFGWAILAALCWGIAPLFEKFGLQTTNDPQIGVYVRSLGVFAGVLIFMLFTPRVLPRLHEISARTWLFLITGGILASILGQICFYRALKLGEVSRMTPIGASYPVLSFLLGVLLLGESVTTTKLFGIILVTTGVYLLR
jgi:bacterial/archaeal transporter family protein